tara:strand:+ start:50100 stop:50282 length:183 start_codon:yes stop_codon:yes gene_type:complete
LNLKNHAKLWQRPDKRFSNILDTQELVANVCKHIRQSVFAFWITVRNRDSASEHTVDKRL